MKKRILYALWGGLFIVCAGLGFIPEAAGVLRTVLTTLSIVFFLPPALLLYGAVRENDRNTLRLVRNLSLLSLAVTLVTLMLNFVLAVSAERLGNILHYFLVIVSAPMICSGYWVLSLFLWACLLMVSIQLLKK